MMAVSSQPGTGLVALNASRKTVSLPLQGAMGPCATAQSHLQTHQLLVNQVPCLVLGGNSSGRFEWKCLFCERGKLHCHLSEQELWVFHHDSVFWKRLLLYFQ